MSRIIAVHLPNDRSSSPLVLRQSLEVLQQAGYSIDLLAATPGELGGLSELPGVRLHALPSRWAASQGLTLLHFALVQCVVFWRVLLLANAASVVYVGSLLPAGAALAARCRGARVVYHLHEVAVRPAALRPLLCAVARRTAHQLLYASEHVRTTLVLPVARQQVVYTALTASFISQARQAPLAQPAEQPFVVLMAGSLRDCQGVPEFLALAASLPQLRFELVLSAAPAAVAAYAAQHPVPANLTLFPALADMHAHYARATVVANLARPGAWAETVGLTVLEGLSYGRPVLVPPVSGAAELSVHTQTGFAIDGHDLPTLQYALQLLHEHPDLYADMAAAARQRAATFAPECFARQLRQVFEELLLPVPQVRTAPGRARHGELVAAAA